MLKKIRLLLSILLLICAATILITGNYESQSYLLFLMGFLMVAIGLQEFQKQKKVRGWIVLNLSLIIFFVSIQGVFV